MARMVGSSVANMREETSTSGPAESVEQCGFASVVYPNQRDGASGTALRASRRSARCLRTVFNAGLNFADAIADAAAIKSLVSFRQVRVRRYAQRSACATCTAPPLLPPGGTFEVPRPSGEAKDNLIEPASTCS